MRKTAYLVFALVIAMACIPAYAASAGEQSTDDVNSGLHTIRANSEQLELIQEIWGTPMSIGEYLETVYPEELQKVLNEIPADLHHCLWETEHKWGDRPGYTELDASSDEERKGRPELRLAASTTLKQEGERGVVTIDGYIGWPTVWPGAGHVWHAAEIKCSQAMVYIAAHSTLWRNVGSGPELCEGVWNWRAMFWSSVKCEGDFETTDDGYYWNNTAYDWTSYPGWTPLSGTMFGFSPNIYLEP